MGTPCPVGVILDKLFFFRSDRYFLRPQIYANNATMIIKNAMMIINKMPIVPLENRSTVSSNGLERTSVVLVVGTVGGEVVESKMIGLYGNDGLSVIAVGGFVDGLVVGEGD